MNKKQVGPQEVNIPSFNFKSCQNCEFHKSEILRSGRDPIYAHYCKNQDINKKPNELAGTFFRTINGEYIGDDSTTPEWCPVVKLSGKAKKEFYVIRTHEGKFEVWDKEKAERNTQQELAVGGAQSWEIVTDFVYFEPKTI